RLLPNRPVYVLVERRTTRGKLALLVMLGAHQGRAITKRSADPIPNQLSVLHQLPGKVGLRQGSPAHADESDPPVANVRSTRVEQVFLQVAIAAADHW